MNDALDYIAEDPNFGKNLKSAILHLQVSDGEPIDVSARSAAGGIHCNAATAIESHHADQTSVVTFGGNCGQVLGTYWGWGERFGLNKPESKVKLLKDLAATLGYDLHKKPIKKPINNTNIPN